MRESIWIRISIFIALILSACGAPSDGRPEDVGSVSAALSTITLTSSSDTSGGYDFEKQVYHGLSGGDFYYTQGAFWANNVGQNGVVSVGPCSSPNSVTTMPITGYSRWNVTATVGNCYVALTQYDQRDYIVFHVDSISGNNIALTWKLVTTGWWGATLSSGSSASAGYDFDTRTYKGNSGGDFYFYQGAFWANNVGQRGVVSVGACNNVDSVASVPMSGYSIFAVTATAGNCYVSLGQNEEHGNIVFRVDTTDGIIASLTFKIVDDCYGLGSTTYNKNVNCWLTKNPTVAQYVIWEKRVALGSSSVTTWSQWTNSQRDDLRKNVVNYESLLANTITQDPDPLTDPPTNQLTMQDSDMPVLVLSFNDAWRLYVKEVAMSLAVELKSYVPWSVTSYSAQSLAALFDSRNTITYTWSGRVANLGIVIPQIEGYIAVSNSYDPSPHTTLMPYASYAAPAPPAKALAFIRSQSLQGSTRVATITNTISWARRLFHLNGARTAHDYQQIWGYRGPAPVSATIATTISSYPGDPTDARHYTAGCHGTAVFLHSVLRTINIPVDANESGIAWGHSTPRFMTDGIYLAHADDPYYNDDIYDVAPASLFISEATYRAWFLNNTMTAITGSSPLYLQEVNRGDEAAMLAVGTPLGTSTWLKYLYCFDAPGTAPANSMVMTAFNGSPDIYSVSYLQNLPTDPSYPSAPASLWGRLSQAVTAAGGCTAVQSAFTTQQNACNAVQPPSERLRCTVK